MYTERAGSTVFLMHGGRARLISTALWLCLAGQVFKTQAQPSGKSYGVVIGVDQYLARGLPWLGYAVRDARLFESHLRSERGGALEGVTVLVDKGATRTKILDALRNVLTVRAGPRDEVFIFLSARGVGSSENRHGLLLGYDGNYENPSTAVKVAELGRLIRQSNARLSTHCVSFRRLWRILLINMSADRSSTN